LLSLGVLGGGGELSYPGRKLVDITRFGADGVGRRRTAKRPSVVTLRGKLEALDAATAAVYILSTLPSLEGFVHAITLAGIVHPNFAVEGARCIGRRPIRKAIGGTIADPRFLLDVEFDVVYVGAP
jgi:hypothetical protein